MQNKKISLTLLIVLLSVTFICGTAFSAGKIKTKGMLTAVEREGNITSVEIDKYGYIVDPSAKIIDQNKKPVSLRSFKLPIKVHFEYKYAEKGFIIILIEELPDVVPE